MCQCLPTFLDPHGFQSLENLDQSFRKNLPTKTKDTVDKIENRILEGNIVIHGIEETADKMSITTQGTHPQISKSYSEDPR